MSLTILEACKLVSDNVNASQMDFDLKLTVIKIVELLTLSENENFCPTDMEQLNFSSDCKRFTEGAPTLQIGIGGFGVPMIRSKKFKHKHKNKNKLIAQVSVENQEYPGDVYAGGAEVLAGALLLILTPVCPIAGVVGGGLIADGTSRIISGVVEMGEANKLRQNGSLPPPSPGGYNF